MHEYFTFALLGFTSFFTLINPLGVMPIYLSMTADLDKEMKKRTARKATIVSFIILVLFAVTGQLIFKFFGITINSLKVVGGVIFFLMGQDMLQARLVRAKISEKEVNSYTNDISITPLAIPMICGPGAITNAILMMDTAESIVFQGILIIVLSIVCFATYLILLNSTRIYNLLGETGNNILMRLMGLIVMVIAVEFIVSGLTPIIRTILKIE
ncbi:MarC family protein [Cytobacillus praedii]|uniref:MarC family protein n=1 Tax=Cytobacillus praedii TaxID=1742358 RepID=UPI002E249B24|nr:MarC family protein [Cytobacillus praedii]MED3550452.1 NAAT family transporter [Cytobacillus praedii]